jgi:hypothetical protein
MEIKSAVMMKQKKKNDTNEMGAPINLDQIDHGTCLNYVYETLRQFADRKRQYQTELNEKKYSSRNSFTLKMEETLRQFIEQREILFTRLQFDSKIAIVNYDYRDRLLELEYQHLKPNQNQVRYFVFFLVDV